MKNKVEENRKNISNGNEINLIELFQYIWSKKKFIIIFSLIFFILGIITALTTPKEYKAGCKLLPEISKSSVSNLGGLGNLAGFAGINLDVGGSNGLLNPILYPEILSSSSFLDSLINQPLYFENINQTISSKEYFKKYSKKSLTSIILDNTIGLPKKIFKSKEITEKKLQQYASIKRYSSKDWEILENFSDRLSLEINKKSNLINISVEMPDPVAAAQTVQIVTNRLKTVIENYKLKRSRENLEFIQNQFENAKIDYLGKQKKLSKFSDRNRNITTSIARFEYIRLKNDLNISFEVYKQLAGQLEKAKLKVKEETPVFSILEEVRIPEKKNKPKRLLIIIIFSFLGFFLSLTYTLTKKFITNVKQ